MKKMKEMKMSKPSMSKKVKETEEETICMSEKGSETKNITNEDKTGVQKNTGD